MLLIRRLYDNSVVTRLQQTHYDDIIGARAAVDHHHLIRRNIALWIYAAYGLLYPWGSCSVAVVIVEAHGLHVFQESLLILSGHSEQFVHGERLYAAAAQIYLCQ